MGLGDDERSHTGKYFPIPKNEIIRLKILQQTDLLDTKEEENYDRYTSMAARLFHIPVSSLNLVDTNRIFLKSRFGLKAKEIPRQGAFCCYTIMEDSLPVIVAHDTLKDPRFIDSPYVVNPPHYRFYAGASITIEGQKIGTLCLLDTKPLGEDRFGEREALILQDLACIVGNLIRTRREEKLSNIYESLMMNADILKLYRIPLQNVMECKKSVEKVYRKTVASSRHRRPSTYFPCVRLLQEKTDKLSRQVKLLLNVSSIIIKLMKEIYQLYHFSTLSDLSDDLLVNTLKQCNPHSIDNPFIYRSLTQMHYKKVQTQVQQYIETTLPPTNARKEEQSLVKYQRLTDSLPTDSAISIYSYPTLVQVILMVLYNIFDFWGEKSQITVNARLKQGGEEDENEVIRCGVWCINVRLLQQESNIDIHFLTKLFTIFERVSHCRHYMIHQVRGGDDERKKEDSEDVTATTPTSSPLPSSSSSRLIQDIYRIEIPFYLFDFHHDERLNQCIGCASMSCSERLSLKTSIKKKNEEDQLLTLSMKQKPTCSSNSASSSKKGFHFASSSFHSLQKQWSFFRSFQKSLQKIYNSSEPEINEKEEEEEINLNHEG
eukprot:gene2997-3184_t